MSNKYQNGKYRISIAGDKNTQNKPVIVTDVEGNDMLGGASSYTDLDDLPTVNGVTVEGDMTSSDLGLQPALVSGTNIKTVNGQTILGGGDLEVDRHFRGWYDSESDLPADGRVGDYAYVKGATASDPAAIYAWDASLETPAWVDTERTADTSNVQTFASGEKVNETPIDDTHLVNPADGALPTANDVLQLKAKLEGNSIYETKQTYTEKGGYINWMTGVVTSPSSNSRYYDFQVPTGATKVRFLGVVYNTSPSAGYAFFGENNSYIQGFPYSFDTNLSTTETKEYIVEIPNGAKVFKTNVQIASSTINNSNFYCYFVFAEKSIENIGIYSRSLNITNINIELEQGLLLSSGYSYPITESSDRNIQNKRVRTKGFIFVNGKATLSFTNGVNYNIYYYKDSYQESFDKRESSSWLTAQTYNIDYVGYIRLIFKNTNSTTITIYDFSANIEYATRKAYDEQYINDYLTNNVRIKLANIVIKDLKSEYLGQLYLSNNQSFLRYNDNYISVCDDSVTNNVAVVDNDFNLVTSKHLDIGHGNSFQLGNNNKAYVSGWDDNKVYIIDLSTLEIESTITLPVTGYTTVAVDDLNHLMYIFHRTSYPSTVENYNFIVYDYANNNILSTKVIEAFNYMQSVDYYQGKIYMCWGAPQYDAASGMRVYNTNGDVLFDIEIDAFQNAEPEGIFVDRESGDLIVSDVNKVYRIDSL